MADRFHHRLPFGAEFCAEGRVHFRIWAPSAAQVELHVAGSDPVPMQAEGDGWFHSEAACAPGTAYDFHMPDGLRVPDPASRLQQTDVHGASVLTDPVGYVWKHPNWSGRPFHEAVIYELHPGACDGFAGIERRLPALAALGVTMIELMPIAAFPGAHNWGYDGVLPYAPANAYGTPDELKSMVDAAHGLGLMVMLDVVYNHFGPDGAYLHAYAKPFFNEDLHTPWGAAIDFRRSQVADFFSHNALYWLEEFRFDGLRFDAVHAIAPPEFLAEMERRIRGSVSPERHIHLVLEHEGNAAHLLRKSPTTSGFDAQWTDDFHHCLHVLLTGEREGYYEDFQDPANQLARCLAEGFAYQGEVSPHSGKSRGEPSAHLPLTSFVVCLQNHDQIGNRAMGERLTALADPEALEAATGLLLLTPFVPLLFMGEEWGTRTPFLFFTDHNDELAALVRDGRRREFRHFAAFQDKATRAAIPDPNAPETFAASVPDPVEAKGAPHEGRLGLYRGLLTVRRQRLVPHLPGAHSAGASAIGAGAVRAAWTLGNGSRLTLLLNLGGTPAATDTVPGELLHASSGDVAAALAGGALPPRRFAAYLAPAAG